MVDDAGKRGSTELLPPPSCPHKCTVLPLETGIDCLVLTALTIEIDVHPSIPCLVKGRELPVFNKWANFMFSGKVTDLLIDVSFVSELDMNVVRIALGQGRRNGSPRVAAATAQATRSPTL